MKRYSSKIDNSMNLATINDLQTGVLSQTYKILHFPAASEVFFFWKPLKKMERHKNGQYIV